MKNKNKIKISIAITSLLALTLVFNQCVIDQKVNPSRRGETSSDSQGQAHHHDHYDTYDEYDDYSWDDPYEDEMMAAPMVPPVNVEEVREVTPDYGIKNFEQIYYTMSVLTGVSPNNSRVKAVFDDVSSALPSNNDIKTFSTGNQVSILKLATEFCHQMIDDSDLRRDVYPDVNFRRTPNEELNREKRAYLIERTIDHFLGQGVLGAGERNFIYAELNTLVSNLLDGSNLDSRNTTQMVGKGLCVTALGSIHNSIF